MLRVIKHTLATVSPFAPRTEFGLMLIGLSQSSRAKIALVLLSPPLPYLSWRQSGIIGVGVRFVTIFVIREIEKLLHSVE